MLYYPDGTIQHAGVILGLGGIAGYAGVRAPRSSRGYFGRACIEQDISCVTAACMAVRTPLDAGGGVAASRVGLARTAQCGARAAQYVRDATLIGERWRPALEVDSFYNVNLSLERGYGLAFPPRHAAAGDAPRS